MNSKKGPKTMSECGRSCKYWPPSDSQYKPCSKCDTSMPELNCFTQRGPGRPKKEDAMHGSYRLRLNDIQRSKLKALAAKNQKTEAAMLRELVTKAFERAKL